MLQLLAATAATDALPQYCDTAFACNKREPDKAVTTGINRIHALSGASDQRVAVHPPICAFLWQR